MPKGYVRLLFAGMLAGLCSTTGRAQPTAAPTQAITCTTAWPQANPVAKRLRQQGFQVQVQEKAFAVATPDSLFRYTGPGVLAWKINAVRRIRRRGQWYRPVVTGTTLLLPNAGAAAAWLRQMQQPPANHPIIRVMEMGCKGNLCWVLECPAELYRTELQKVQQHLRQLAE